MRTPAQEQALATVLRARRAIEQVPEPYADMTEVYWMTVETARAIGVADADLVWADETDDVDDETDLEIIYLPRFEELSDDDPLLTVPQAAERSGMPEAAIRAHLHRDHVKCYKAYQHFRDVTLRVKWSDITGLLEPS